MKKNYIFAAIVILMVNILYSQTPQKFNYQAVARDASGNLIANQNVSLRISILQASDSGTAVYVETHLKITNSYGQVNLLIGGGTMVSGTFASILWGNNIYFIKTEMDASGGNNYALMGTSQLLAVPYALHSKTAETITGSITETDPIFVSSSAHGITNTNITNWTTAFGWGNHATAGYLTSFTESDPKVGNNTAGFSPKWNGSSLVTGAIYQDANGKIGVGTTTPNYKLDVFGNSSMTMLYDRDNTNFYIDPASTSILNDVRGSIFYDKDNTTYYIDPANVTNSAILAGNVGVGTATPATKLDVLGVITATGGNSSNWNTAFAWGNHSGLYRPIGWTPTWTDITAKPALFDGTWLSLTGKPIFAAVATSGSYNDLTNKPTIPAAQVNSDWNSISGLSQILNKPALFDGDYNSLTNKPILTNGTVTNVTAISPISVIQNTSTPVISINKADNTNDGYLSSVDWNLFNSKQSSIPGSNFQTLMYNGTWMASSLIYNDDSKMGIGTSTPADVTHKLTVMNNTSVETFRLIGPGSFGSTAKMNFGDGNYTYISEDSDDKLTINATGRTAIMGGNVGIGTDAPNQKLTVAGTIQSTSGGVMFPDNTVQTTASQTQYLYRHADTIFLSNGSYVVLNPLVFLMPPVVDIKNVIAQAFNANLYGIVNANNLATTAEFEWGLTSAYGNTIACSQNPVTGMSNKQVSAFLTGLQSNTTYHYRLRATNANNFSYTSDFTFTTLPSAPQVTTTDASSILTYTAVSGGEVTYNGGSAVTERGICYSTVTGPTTSNTKVVSGSGNGVFTSNLSGLSANTTYYVRAYATNAYGTNYGDEVVLTTQSIVFTMVTTSATSVTSSAATVGGNITYDGGSAVTVRGICYSILPNPTTSSPKITSGSGSGSFTANLIGLNPNTTYHARAYATNGVATYYGNDINFKTQNGIAVLTTQSVFLVYTNSASVNANISNDGGATVTARGFCWSTSPNPTLSNTHSTNASGTGSFSNIISGLSINNTYYVRAYATNSSATFYGNELSFSTGIGANYQGGIIAYIFQSGDNGYVAGQTHGLIAAPTDQSTGIQWYNGTYYAIYGMNPNMGFGNANTNIIVSSQGAGNYAAKICYDLTLGGYSDWYLPSEDELYTLFLNKSAIGGFAEFGEYWSSCEHGNSYEAGSLNIYTGAINNYSDKSSLFRVRAVRSF